MMIAAQRRLEQLEEDTSSPFAARRLSYRDLGSKYGRFLRFAGADLGYIIRSCSHRLLSLDQSSQNIPSWFLTTSLTQYNLSEEGNFACFCSGCVPAQSRSRASKLESSQDTCGELLLLQNRMIHHDVDEDQSWQALVRLSHEVRERASEIFESEGVRSGAELAKSSGVYHPDAITWSLPVSLENLSDCLGRSQLHLRMDHSDLLELKDILGTGLHISKLKDSQDILGRTALFIACQRDWGDGVRFLLEEEADPALATIYGSLPLHYAAAEGSIDICQLLLSHKTKFDIKAMDSAGKTALDYARDKKHQDVTDLLSAEYVVADQALVELERVRRLQGAYFI